jgi:hypothetical protein
MRLGDRNIAFSFKSIVKLRTGVTAMECEQLDLLMIAEGWGVPPTTPAWVIVTTCLAGTRQRSVILGKAGSDIAASSRMLAAQGERRNRKKSS